MHQQARSYVERAIADIDIDGMEVIEIGSFDVNGSVRPLFAAAASYTGIDVRPGRGVDLVADGAVYQPENPVDLAVSTEALEHAPDQPGLIANMARMLKPGGMLILTAAGVERQPHSNDGHHGTPAGEFYRNVSEEDLRAWLLTAGFGVFAIERDARAGDIYATAYMPEAVESEPEAPVRPRRTRKAKSDDQ